MQELLNWFDHKIAPVKRELILCFVFTFIWGMAAHSYRYYDYSISHDSMAEFFGTSSVAAWKLSLGRFMTPVMYLLRGNVSSGFWLGMLSLFYISIAVFIITRIFQLTEHWAICLVSGIMTVNLTYTAMAATFIGDIDCNCLALLLAVLAVYLWRHTKFGYCWGSLAVALSLGCYQSFISVTITLIIFVCIADLLRDHSFKEVFTRGLRSIVMLVLGGLVYICILKLATGLSGIQVASDNYNSLDKVFEFDPSRLIPRLWDAWKKSIRVFTNINSMYPSSFASAIQWLLIGICCAFVLKKLLHKATPLPEKLLLTGLFLLLPLAMNITRVLSNGMSHDLMYYAIWLTYVLAIILVSVNKVSPPPRTLAFAQVLVTLLLSVTLFSNIQISNTVYNAKSFIKDANLSLFTRIVYSIEQTAGYSTGETPVAFIGKPKSILTDLPEEFNKYSLTGYNNSYVIGATVDSYYEYYFRYILMNPTVIAPNETVNALTSSPEVMDMPVYPMNGSVKMIGDTLVVKLSQIDNDT